MVTKRVPAKLNPKNYAYPKVWTKGFKSKAMERKFARTAKLRKYHDALLAYTGSASATTKAQKLKGLPQRVRRKRR